MVFLFQQLTFHAATRVIFKNTNFLQNAPVKITVSNYTLEFKKKILILLFVEIPLKSFDANPFLDHSVPQIALF